jgi:AmiR/NasT family two-component response regulator
MDIALDSRSLVGQATGIMMGRYDIDAVRAFAVLRWISPGARTSHGHGHPGRTDC